MYDKVRSRNENNTQAQRYTSNIQMQLNRKNNNNSYPTNQIHLKMLIFQVVEVGTTLMRGKKGPYIDTKRNQMKNREGKREQNEMRRKKNPT